jgi:hypothetical protein
MLKLFGGQAPESVAAFELSPADELLKPINRETTRGTRILLCRSRSHRESSAGCQLQQR